VLNESVDVVETVIAGASEVVDETFVEYNCRRSSPDGGDKGKAGEIAPLFGEIVVDEFFAGALEAVGAFFEGHESGVADEDGGVSMVEHGIEIGGHGDEGNVGIPPFVKENARVGDGGAARGVGGDAAQFGERLRGAAHEDKRAYGVLRRDGAAGKDLQAGSGGEGCDGYEADVGGAGCKLVGALRGEHQVDLITLGKFVGERWMFEIPHEGCGIEETDCGDAEPAMRNRTHSGI